MVVILVLVTILTFLTVDYFVERAAARRAGVAVGAARGLPVIARAPVDLERVPGGVFVSPGHVWLSLEPEGAVRVGADRLPGVLLGDVDRVETVPVGTRLHRGDRVAALGRGERTVELAAPVDGTVTAVHRGLGSEPGAVARDPFGEGWIVRLVPDRLADALRRLFVADEAETWMGREIDRLRDALVRLARPAGAPALATATLPDGGLPVTGVAAELTDEAWSELAERFFTVPVVRHGES